MSTALRNSTRPADAPARANYQGPAAAQMQLLAQQLGLGTAAPAARQLLGVTSMTPGAGVTTVAYALAATVAGWSTREVLLVDAHHARPSLSRSHNARSAGLTEVCLGRQDLEPLLENTEYPGLRLLPSGAPPAAPFAVDALLCACAERFDHVIVDLPPLGACQQALALLTALDGVVLVVEAERDSRERLAEARGFLERLSAPLAGAVLNKQRHALPGWLRPGM